ncbi:MAG: hypothetical protein QNJ85_08765 [Gammaproteobacteria bacterium]|nr:hypothetical protein [Gammaproteobacteria bacterium]
MDRILLIITVVLFYCAPAVAAGETGDYDDFRYTPVSYQEIEFDETKPIIGAAGYDWFFDVDVSIEDSSANGWLHSGGRYLEAGLGLGVAPFFDSYGVFRTSSNDENPTYFVLGYVSDELVADDATLPDEVDDRGFSVGFGISESSFSLEYMISVDEADYEFSTIGVGFISEF